MQLLTLSDHTMTEQLNPQALLTQVLSSARTYLDCIITSVEVLFNERTQNIDFPFFCVIYALILLWLLKRFNRRVAFRPVNKQVQDWKTRAKRVVKEWVVTLPVIKQMVQKKFDQGIAEMEVELEKDIEKNRDPHKSKKLPEEGMKKQNLESRIHKWVEVEQSLMFSGKLSGSFYPDSHEICKEASDFATKYMYHNPLHLDTYKELTKIEAQVIKMTGSLISNNRVYGVITSGGSESLIMTLYTYKKFGGKERPNIVVPCTIHAAIDKGAAYFNIEVRKSRLNEHYEADVEHMEELIDSNTIAMYCSYPNYPHGIIDPIQDIAHLALKYKIPLHVDACLGGFVAGFLPEHKDKLSLDMEGVTSISLDHHKYALAPKGISTVFFKTTEMRQQMYFFYSTWVGGLYGTPSFVGSRSGFASAGAWYCLTQIGRNQYKQNAVLVSETVKKTAKDLKAIEGVEIIGNPTLCVVAFNTTNVDIYNVCSYLQKNYNWNLGALHLPKGIHVSVTPANAKNVSKNLASNVASAITYLLSSNEKQSSTAAFYGANAKMPDDMGAQMLRAAMKVYFS